jgi:hypothetical protein
LAEKAEKGHIIAQDVCEIVASTGIQEKFWKMGIQKPKISLWTAWRWLAALKWWYGRKQSGMYIDGHE